MPAQIPVRVTYSGSDATGLAELAAGDWLLAPDIVSGLIRRDTADGADNSYLTLAGGGAASQDRGAYVRLDGNESASVPGRLALIAGNVAGGELVIITGGAVRGSVLATGELSWNGDIIAGTIRRGTADGADNGILFLTGGGFAADSRGGTIGLYGNETASTGAVRLIAGTPGSIEFYTGASVERGRITSAGVLAWGTTVTTGASAGDVVLAHGNSIRSVNSPGTSAISVIGHDTPGGIPHIKIGGGYGLSAYPEIGGQTYANLPIGDVTQNGMIVIDKTNNRLCYWSSNGRFYITGTAF